MDTFLPIDTAAVEQLSKRFLGQWSRLVSVTNWEKGRIICQWRDTLQAQARPPREFSDETWSRQVGQISSQHVGRLRRVHERFHQLHTEYTKLYWSHFLAALDWTDAEQWLSAASQGRWSVEAMRNKRWEALGGKPGEEPEAAIPVAEYDEDAAQKALDTTEPSDREPDEPDYEKRGSDFDTSAPWEDEDDDFTQDAYRESNESETVRPFAELPELPPDLADAFESFKLAILRHKLDDWQEISRNDVLATLETLKQLVVAPSA